MARKYQLKMRIAKGRVFGRGKGQRVFFHIDDVKKLSELVKKRRGK